jgi:hypothetical protein
VFIGEFSIVSVFVLFITSTHANQYFDIVRIAVVLPWFTFLFTLFAAVMLFVTSSHVDRLEQAHEETHARIGVETNKISTVDRDTKEGTGLRRSPMLVSEKSAAEPSSPVGSPDSTHKSHSIADHSPLAT